MAIAIGLVILKFVILPFFSWKGDVIDEITLLKRAVAHKKAFAGSESKINEVFQKVKDSFEQSASFYYRDFTDVRSIQLTLQKNIEKSLASFYDKAKGCCLYEPFPTTLKPQLIRI